MSDIVIADEVSQTVMETAADRLPAHLRENYREIEQMDQSMHGGEMDGGYYAVSNKGVTLHPPWQGRYSASLPAYCIIFHVWRDSLRLAAAAW